MLLDIPYNTEYLISGCAGTSRLRMLSIHQAAGQFYLRNITIQVTDNISLK